MADENPEKAGPSRSNSSKRKRVAGLDNRDPETVPPERIERRGVKFGTKRGKYKSRLMFKGKAPPPPPNEPNEQADQQPHGINFFMPHQFGAANRKRGHHQAKAATTGNFFYSDVVAFRPSIMVPTINRVAYKLRAEYHHAVELSYPMFKFDLDNHGVHSPNTRFLNNKPLGNVVLDFVCAYMHSSRV